MPNIGTQMFEHLLDALLLFMPNCCQIVYVEPSPLKDSCIFLLLIVREFTSTLLLPPQLLSSCLVPLVHRYCRHLHFCCSLLIVVCLRRCHCRRRRLCFQHRHCRPPSDGRHHNFCCRNSCRCVAMIVIAVLVAAVDNDAVLGPHCSLPCRSSPSLLSRRFLRHCICVSAYLRDNKITKKTRNNH